MSEPARPRLTTAAVACFVVGAGVLVAFDKAVTLALGVVLLLAFIVLGVFAIASPEYLARETDEPPG
jgi:1,4-dihydroxy-2-naphthoate octaprenyltransferase